MQQKLETTHLNKICKKNLECKSNKFLLIQYKYIHTSQVNINVNCCS